MTTPRFLVSIVAAGVAGCANAPPPPAVSWAAPPFPLPSAEPATDPPSPRLAAHRAYRDLAAAPRDLDRIIWYGRRLAYTGSYQEAIDVYSVGLTLYPDSPRLLRHRGHRYISTRRFAEAVADLERAARLIAGRPDEIEADGQPNALGIPTSSLHTNVWYHLGLARYCRGEFESAHACYERCLAAAENPDMEVATRYWLYLTAVRLGDGARARAALEPVAADWDVIENHAYHRLLLLYKGELDEAALATDGGDAIQDKTVGYGLARYEFVRGDAAAGEAALRALVAEPSPAFGCIAAEADLARGGPAGR